MRALKLLPLVLLCTPLPAQTGHVLNDIRTLFQRNQDLKQRIWSLQAQINNLKSAESPAESDSLVAHFQALLEEQEKVFEGALAAVNRRLKDLEMLEPPVSNLPPPAQRALLDDLPLYLAGGALLLSLLAVIIVLVKRRRPKPPKPKQLELQLETPIVAKTPKAETRPVAEKPKKEPAIKQLTPDALPDQPITTETVSKRSEIMELLGKAKPKSKAKKSRSKEADHKRELTDRASELILLTSRGQLDEEERADAEREIAGILKEIMELR